MSTRPHISVVIPTYQRRAAVEQALLALIGQRLPAEQFEVIVSIDGSNDGTQQLVETFTSPYALRVLWQPNSGRAAACNAGILAAVGDVVVLLDDDMEATPGFLEGHLRAHPAGSRLGVIGAAPIRTDKQSPPVVAFIGHKFNQHLARLAEPDHQIGLRDFYSGNFSIRREVLLGIGLFDEAFKIYGNEDVELSLRLKRAGVRLCYGSEALAYQSYTKNFAALAHDNIAKGRTAVLMWRKHPETFRELKLSAYKEGSPAWRLLRAGLLRLSHVRPHMVDQIISVVSFLERRPAPLLRRCYMLTLDYCYWFGAQAALRELNESGAQSDPLSHLVQL